MGFVATAQIPRNELEVDINVFPKEQPKLSINSNILLAGESLLYEITVLNDSNKKSTLSKVGYVSLQNENDSIVFNHKLKLENGIANSDFFLPSNLKTGIYRLIGYTNFSRNNQIAAFDEKEIYVINTFTKAGTDKMAADTIALNAISEKDYSFFKRNVHEEPIKINADKQNYGFRDKVTVSIENLLGENSGNYLLSVRKINPVKIPKQTDEPIKNALSETFYIPEVRGELISGLVVLNSDNSPVADKVVSLTIPGKDFIVKTAKTNKNGRFFFSVSEEYSSENSIVQLVESSDSASNYRLDFDDKKLIPSKMESSVLRLDPSLKEWLQERSVQIQIENAYFDKKGDSILAKAPHSPFYNNLGTLYLLDDYTRFPSVRETFVEIITLAAIRGSGETSRFLVYNDYDPNGIGKFNDIPPLVLVDGMLIQNNNELIEYKAHEINSIRVIKAPYRYGPKLYSGIISVKTKKGDFKPTLSKNQVEEFNLPPAIKKKQRYQTDYNHASALARIPDYRVQLLWQPEVVLQKEGYTTTFFTSDILGTYEIRLEGFSDSGSYKVVRNYFEVGEERREQGN